MRTLLVTIFCLAMSASVHSQTWITKNIGGNGGFTVSPIKQFAIDPYRNSMWFVLDGKASVIESDGNYRIFDHYELESAFTGENLFFAFSPNHIYYKVDLVGLKSFDNYIPSDLYSCTDVRFLSTDGDSVFFYEGDFSTIFRYHESSTVNSYMNCAGDFRIKNGIIYKDSGPIFYPTDLTGNGVWLFNDPDYLPYGWNDFQFSRYTDTLYIGQQSGISYAYLEDVVGSFSPSNTTNMPAAKVLKLEFDMNDNLWALFGDGNNDPFAIAMLDGTNWTNIYDASNSPINFSNFQGFQFDTLNNIWVAETYKLHTIDNVNSPQWLSTLELNQVAFDVYPNPSEGSIHLSIPENVSVSTIEILDFSGKLIAELPFQTEIELENSGVYFIRIISESGVLGVEKVIVE